MTFHVDPSAPAALLEKRMQETFGTSHQDYERERGRGPIPRAYLNTSIEIIDRSGVVPQMQEWQAAQRKSNAGRKPDIPLRAVLILFLLHVQLGYGVNYHSIARTLDVRLTAEEFAELGIRDRPADHADWYQRLWRATNRMLKLVDPYPSPHNARLSPERYAELLEQQGSDEAHELSQRNLARIDWICEQLIHESVRKLPPDVWARYHGNIAIDATEVIVKGNPNPKNPMFRRGNADPQSGRYRREGNHDGQGATTFDAAYELETGAMVWDTPGENDRFPSLVTSLSFHRPGELIGHGVKLIDSHQRLGFTRILVICDRAYNGQRPENFQIPARLRGCELVIDYQFPDLGLQDFHKDLILVDGNWFVRWMPTDLVTATRDAHDGRITAEQEQQLVASRTAYRMVPKGLPDADGYQRFSYPAPGYMAIDPITKLRVKPSNPDSITIPMLVPEGDKSSGKDRKRQPMKHLQKFQFHTEEWNSYFHMRPLVEASHKLMKDAGAEDLGNPAKRSGRGYVFHYLASTLAAVSSNLRRIFTFFVNEAKRALGGNCIVLEGARDRTTRT